MGARIRHPSLALVVVVAGLASAAPPWEAENDAGTGLDAGDEPGAALPLTANGGYMGNLTTPGQDADWYRRAASSAEPVCGAGRAAGVLSAHAILSLGAAGPSVTRTIVPSRPPNLAAVAPASDGAFLGLRPFSTTLSVGTGDDDTKHHGGQYRFELGRFTRTHLDPEGDGEGADAGSTAATAKPVPGTCFAGRLGAGDVADGYAFPADEGDLVDVSFVEGATDAALRVVDPRGATRARLEGAGAVALSIDLEGAWLLLVESTAAAAPKSGASVPLPGLELAASASTEDYLVAVSSDDPDSVPCRPVCKG